MAGSFYLNPDITRTYCNNASFKLRMMNDTLESAKNTINNSEIFQMQGNAVDEIESHMGLYMYVIQKYIDANNADIRDFATLRASLGNEVLDSEAINWAQSLIDKENAWLSSSIRSNNSAIRKLSKKDDLKRFFYNAANKAASAQIAINNKLLGLLNGKSDEYNRINYVTSNLFQTGALIRWVAGVYLSELQSCVYDEKTGRYIYKPLNNKIPLSTLIKTLNRKPGMTDEEWQNYCSQIMDLLILLEADGWHSRSLSAYIEIINKSETEDLDEIMKDTKEVGSKVFMDMWYAWPAVTQETAEEKLRFFLEFVDMGELTPAEDGKYMVGDQYLDDMLTRFNKDLDPNNFFWSDYALLVRTALPNGLTSGAGVDEAFIRNVHQFRYVIDAQQVGYIRANCEGDTDEDKLANYIKSNELITGQDWDFESARLHNKIKKDMNECEPESYPGEMINRNMKVLVSDAFHSEFIVDSEGKFVYVLNQTTGEVYRKNSIINGASFNYARENDYWNINKEKNIESEHAKYDVNSGKIYDPEFRRNELSAFDSLDTKKRKGDNPKYKESDIYHDVEEMQDDFSEKVF